MDTTAVGVKAWDGLADLVHRIEDGDAGAESELVERFQHGLALLLRRIARDEALAEDLRQETLCLVIEKVRQTDERYPRRPGVPSKRPLR